jgi:hypothetical protein
MASLLGVAALCIVLFTWRWPLAGDAQVFHYGNFLIQHGFVPYRNIIDINLPGIYLVDAWAIKVFGAGDLAWRIFDFALLGITCLAMIAIARPYDWIAGLFAGVLFALVHVSEGPHNSGQREEIITTLIMAGCAFLFASRRRRYPWLMMFFGLTFGMAGSVKPTAFALGPCLLAFAVWDLRRKGDAFAAYVWFSLLGASVAAATVAAYLVHFDATDALVEISKRLTPYYAGMGRISFHLLVRFSLPIAAYVLLPFAIGVALSNRFRRSWEIWAILLCGAFGAFSYLLQGKAYAHHRYTFVAFVFLWIALELSQAMLKAGWVKAVGIAGFTVGSLVLIPMYTRLVLQVRPVNLFTPALERDLRHLGIEKLQNNVQCLDLADGCFTALYHLHIVQATGWVGDLLLFAPDHTPVVNFYRNAFWKQVVNNPPSVFVLSDEYFNHDASFAKLKEWPQFDTYLAENYQIVVSRRFPEEGHYAYRIYVRDGMSFPALDQPQHLTPLTFIPHSVIPHS